MFPFFSYLSQMKEFLGSSWKLCPCNWLAIDWEEELQLNRIFLKEKGEMERDKRRRVRQEVG